MGDRVLWGGMHHASCIGPFTTWCSQYGGRCWEPCRPAVVWCYIQSWVVGAVYFGVEMRWVRRGRQESDYLENTQHKHRMDRWIGRDRTKAEKKRRVIRFSCLTSFLSYGRTSSKFRNLESFIGRQKGRKGRSDRSSQMSNAMRKDTPTL